MWLSGLHFPNSYLISLIQAACHENNWSLDQCSLFTSVTKFTSDTEINEKMPIGSYISGLYLEGASWNEDSGLLEKAKYGELIQPMPILKIIPIENHRIKKQNTFCCPVYATSDRCNSLGEGFIFEAYLNTTEHKSFWILRGVCLLLNRD
ncbi:dynein axonemal heavy chain 10-like [Centruroides vittatus]|uniref:dynein axonemal heavy chain 10-like n=1 Tax=Centruroides vittatus TaxID=120091 RepID=UPI00350F209B